MNSRAATGIVRRMMPDDLNRVLEIENLSFSMPWSRAGFEAELAKPYGRSLVFAEDGRVFGYLIAWRVEEDLHIANLAVHPEHRRQGIAEKLLRHCLEADGDAAWAGLEVRVSNAAALTLYRKFGFCPTSLRRAYYSDNREDAVIMTKDLPPPITRNPNGVV
ncbi:ribosomal protein S18-alanine N-acetyltransferase [bacterium]|nr:ribosomal protein S18-alanine N-acetyltransferase [bacterium]